MIKFLITVQLSILHNYFYSLTFLLPTLAVINSNINYNDLNILAIHILMFSYFGYNGIFDQIIIE